MASRAICSFTQRPPCQKTLLNSSEELYEYVKSVSLRESEQLRLLREATQGMELANMQISPDQGQFMAMLVKLMNAKCIVEVGTFTGYSALAMAQAYRDDGSSSPVTSVGSGPESGSHSGSRRESLTGLI